MALLKKLTFVKIIYFCLFISLSGLDGTTQNAPYPIVQNVDDLANIFPNTPLEIESCYTEAKNRALEEIQNILAIPPEERNFENTVRAFDYTISSFAGSIGKIQLMNKVHPKQEMREKALEVLFDVQDFSSDNISFNKKIYKAVEEYFFFNANEPRNEERQYYLSNLLDSLKQEGLDQGDEKFEKKKELSKEISSLVLQFESNIAADNSKLRVKLEDLAGLNEAYISTLEKDKEEYLLPCNYPTQAMIMNYCTHEPTRRDYYKLFVNRAYPQNIEILQALIQKRHELAKLLDYQNFAELEIESQMAQHPDRVQNFLDELNNKIINKAEKEWQEVVKVLPNAINEQGQVDPWNVDCISRYFFEKNFDIDLEVLRHYFPLNATIRNYLNVFENFFNLKFHLSNPQNLWHPSLQLIEVRKPQNDTLVGYILLDLFPREGKFSHACCSSIIPAIKQNGENTQIPSVVLIIANFSPPTETSPSLLNTTEVTTFLHEFGHSIHALVGTAEMPSVAAFNTPMDFVEMPSQLLEDWFTNPQILKKVSSHYITGEVLPDNLIDKLVQTKDFLKNKHLARQIGLARISLEYHCRENVEDLFELAKGFLEHSVPGIAHDPDNHFVTSFGHLGEYGSRYYSYLWSKELAIKFFDYIQSHGGLEDSTVGERYLKVLSKGGSCDPNLLVEQFLEE